MMMIICHNTDLGRATAGSGKGRTNGIFREFSEKRNPFPWASVSCCTALTH